MNKELKKAYTLVEQDLRRRSRTGHANIDIYPLEVRVIIDYNHVWCDSLVAVIEGLDRFKS